jgi:hypothetical protein
VVISFLRFVLRWMNSAPATGSSPFDFFYRQDSRDRLGRPISGIDMRADACRICGVVVENSSEPLHMHSALLTPGFRPECSCSGFLLFDALTPEAREGHAVIRALHVMESNWTWLGYGLSSFRAMLRAVERCPKLRASRRVHCGVDSGT